LRFVGIRVQHRVATSATAELLFSFCTERRRQTDRHTYIHTHGQIRRDAAKTKPCALGSGSKNLRARITFKPQG